MSVAKVRVIIKNDYVFILNMLNKSLECFIINWLN
ncbi:hypothetical protein J2W55_000826 [Mucilaginibacter pocheonensis]|uniref:Uncharacterized protein n=1 Tax=Mucilaginibacter pocheonensis TaxID=398050 RepID=A0ABU1T6J5_9SPHI|nr:hypothetical protein [Mucilaginibacter pocheonensis]